MITAPIVRAFLYAPEAKRLTVAFSNRSILVFSDVPPHLVEALLLADSRTTFFNEYIRHLYRHREAPADAA